MPVRTKEQVLARLHESQAELRRFGVRRCGVFGSFVRNKPGDWTDVDILVEFAPEQKTFDNFKQLAFFLEDLFGRPVDLITTESLSPYIGPHILREVEYGPVGIDYDIVWDVIANKIPALDSDIRQIVTQEYP